MEYIRVRIQSLIDAAEEQWPNGGPGGTIRGTLEPLLREELNARYPHEPHSQPKRKKLSHSKRRIVYERDRYRCVGCGAYKDLTVDHIIPVSQGGRNHVDNMQTMCRSCNSSKGAKVG